MRVSVALWNLQAECLGYALHSNIVDEMCLGRSNGGQESRCDTTDLPEAVPRATRINVDHQHESYMRIQTLKLRVQRTFQIVVGGLKNSLQRVHKV